jgi:small GTP-binding protein
MPRTIQLSKKIVLLGDPSVGKTSVARKFVFDMFDDKYISTLGTKISKKQILFENVTKNTNVKLTMLVWDVMGQRDYSQFHQVAFTGCTGGLLVSDITRHYPIANWSYWQNSLFESVGEVPIILLGNKFDLAFQYQSGVEIFENAVNDAKIHSFFTSAKTGENVEKAFYLLGEQILKKDYNELDLNE